MERDNSHSLENLSDMTHRMYNHYHPKLRQKKNDREKTQHLNPYNGNENDDLIDDNVEDARKEEKNKQNDFFRSK